MLDVFPTMGILRGLDKTQLGWVRDVSHGVSDFSLSMKFAGCVFGLGAKIVCLTGKFFDLL